MLVLSHEPKGKEPCYLPNAWTITHNRHVPLKGHSHWKVVRGCAAVMTPFFHASRRSLAYQFTVNAPLMCPPFQLLDFLALFWPKFSLSRPIFAKFSFPRHTFLQEDLHFRPYFWKPVWHTPTKSWVPIKRVHFTSICFITLEEKRNIQNVCFVYRFIYNITGNLTDCSKSFICSLNLLRSTWPRPKSPITPQVQTNEWLRNTLLLTFITTI